MTRTRNHILAMSVATVLVLYAFGVAMPALSPIPVYAPNEDNDDNNNNGNSNGEDLQFLIDVIECFTDNNNGQFSNDVQDCIDDVIDDYFNNGNNHHNNDHNNNHNVWNQEEKNNDGI
jgi:hypothetical protein